MNEALATKVYNLLSEDDAVTAIVGNRIYPFLTPQNPEYPFVVFEEIDTGTPAETHDDASDLDAVDVQFSCYADDRLVAMQLRTAVRNALFTAGAMEGVKVTGPRSRLLHEAAVNKFNALQEATFLHDPSA